MGAGATKNDVASGVAAKTPDGTGNVVTGVGQEKPSPERPSAQAAEQSTGGSSSLHMSPPEGEPPIPPEVQLPVWVPPKPRPPQKPAKPERSDEDVAWDRYILREQVVGGVLPPPLIEVTVTDRGFIPPSARANPGDKVRFRVSGSLNHILCVGEKQSPLLRGGESWIQAVPLELGVVKVYCEILCLRAEITVVPPPERKPTKAALARAAKANEPSGAAPGASGAEADAGLGGGRGAAGAAGAAAGSAAAQAAAGGGAGGREPRRCEGAGKEDDQAPGLGAAEVARMLAEVRGVGCGEGEGGGEEGEEEAEADDLDWSARRRGFKLEREGGSNSASGSGSALTSPRSKHLPGLRPMRET